MRWGCALLVSGALLLGSASAQTGGRIVYPGTRTVEQVDVLHGVSVADPYRWLEQDVRTSTDVADWVAAQNALTRAYLDALPGREQIQSRLRELWDYDKFSVPTARGERLFYTMQTGLQNQAALYVQDGVAGAPRLLIDPNTWSTDGATALSDYEPSPDGSRLAYAIQDGGTDWRIVRVLDVASGEVLSDEVRWVKFSPIAWAPDGRSFFYARYPEPPADQVYTALNYNHAIYRHEVGRPQSEDQIVYSRPDHPTQGFGFEVTDDGRHLVVTVWEGTDECYEIVLVDLAGRADPQLLVGGFENDYSLVGKDGRGRLLFRTDRNAPRGRVVAIDPRRPAENQWREIVPESENVLVGADRVGDALIARYLVDARSAVRRFALDGRPVGEIELPGLGLRFRFCRPS